ncbi:MAG: polysaccharide biosynthesis protein [Acidobacteria bacterium]|nr:polysaccharide biosynthesis protein [Acidobacteriota bacterium]
MRNRYLLVLDVPLIALCVFLAFVLRFDLTFVFAENLRNLFIWCALAAVVLKPPIFYAFGMYGRYWRYATIDDLVVIGLSASASALALAIFYATTTVLQLAHGFSRSILLIDWLLTLLTIGGLRLSVRIIGEARSRGGGRGGAARKRVLVVGAGQAGTMVVAEIRRNPQLQIEVVGYLDDDPTKKGKRVTGVPVLGDTNALDDVLRGRRIEEVIIAMPTAPGTAVRRIAERAQAAGVASRTMPGVFELLDGAVNVSRLRQIEITDLLRRAPVSGQRTPDEYLAGRVVLVTGAGGSIGMELCRQVARANPLAIVLVGHGENSIFDAEQELRRTFSKVMLRPVIGDIRDERRMQDIFEAWRPSVVFHAAAHKHVPLMEENPEEAITNNIFGTAVLVRAALAHGAERFVLISTDKAVAPTSIMGASKRVAESIVTDAAHRSGRPFVSVRFGNVLGSRGSAVPHFKRQIEMGGPLTITHPDMRRFFMTIPEAVHLVLQAGGMGAGHELFVLDMGEPIRIVDLAQDVIKLSGYTLDEIPIVYTGMRPGEKLIEALWEPDARVEPTAHPEILRVEEQAATPDIDKLLADFARAGKERGAIEAALKRWVTTYVAPREQPVPHPAPALVSQP